MKLFEIIFILLLLLPLALVMRYFITKLSAQRPVQRRYASELEEDKPTVSGWMKKRRSRRAEERALQEEEEERKEKELHDQREYDPSFTPRSPTSLKRTERIPFAQMYGQSGDSSRYARSGNGTRAGQQEKAAVERERKNRDPGAGKSRKRRKKRRKSARAGKRERDRRER